MSNDELSFPIDVEGEDQAAQQIEEAFKKAFKSATFAMANSFSAAFAKMLKKSPFERMARDAQQMTKGVQASLRQFDTVLQRVSARAEQLNRELGQIRIPRGEFVAAATQAERLGDRVEEARQSIDLLARDPGRERAVRDQLAAQTRLTEQLARNFRTLTDVHKTEFAKQREQTRVDQQSEVRLVEAATKERIVLAQQEGAQALAATRRSTQQRLAVFRAFVGQVRALERGLAAVFRTTASALGSSFSAIGRSVASLGGVFRRSNREMVAGLSSSLETRERRIFSSFRQQESIIRSSVNRQSAVLTRFERQASRGIAGAVSGRSQLGALFGGGLALGGGFAAFRVLSDAFRAGGDFIQGLAVLQAQLRLTDEEMNNVRETAIGLGNDITLPGVSAKDAADAINLLAKQFGSLGKGAVPAATAAAKGVLQLSRATQSSAEGAAQVVGAAINVFGIEASKAVTVADQVTGALSRAAGTSFDDFAAAFRQGATVFKQFQEPALGAEGALVEFNVALAALARGGLVGSDAGTALRAFFLQANRGTEDAVENLGILSERAGEVGSVFFDAAGQARPLTEALDIMRRGLDGLSDEERSTVLQKIFGTDAIRAAELLTQTSEATFDSIREGVLATGTAARIAAAQNTGLRGALDALNSVIETAVIRFREFVDPVLSRVILGIAVLTNNLLSAEGGFAVARRAIVGMSVALGGLLVARAAGEAVRFLSIMVRGLLTPFGILALVVAGVGAVIGVMLERSESLRAAFDRVGESLRERFGQAVEFIEEQLGRLGDFIARTVLPALDRLATFVGDNLQRALQTVGRFISTEVVPRLRAFATFLTDTVFPAVRNTLVRGFEIAAAAIRTFWRIVEPILAPAIEGFQQLGDAAADLVRNFDLGTLARIGGVLAAAFAGFAVAGPVGGVVAGAASAIALLFGDTLGAGLLETLGNIGSIIIDAVRPQLERVVSFVTGFFTADRLLDVGRGILQVVEEIGRLIGSVVSDPRFVAAIAGIVGAAVLVVARFTEGLARGIASNAPEWGRLFLAGLREALGFALDGLVNVLTDVGNLATVGVIIASIFTGAGVIGRWRAAGQQAAQAAGGGFATTFRQFSFGGAFAGGGGGTRFGAGGAFLTGLFGAPGAVERQAQRVADEAGRAINRMRSVLRVSGADFIGPRTRAEVTREFNRLSQAIGPSGLAGARLRAAVTATFASLRSVSLAPLRGLGLQVGQIFAGIGRGAASALAGAFAGFQTGQALGDASGLQQILGVGGIALALGTVNPLMGVSAGLAGALGIAFAKMGEQAGVTAEQVGELGTQISQGLDPANVVSASFGQLEVGVRSALAQIGFNIDTFVGKVEEGTLGTQQFVDLLVGAAPGLSQFGQAFVEGKISLDEFVDATQSTNVVGDRLKRLGIDADEVRGILEFLKEQGILVGGAFQVAADQAEVAGRGISDALSGTETSIGNVGSAFATMFGTPPADAITPEIVDVETALNDARTAASNVITEISNLFGFDAQTSLQDALDDFVLALPSLANELGNALFPPEGVTIPPQRLDATRRNVQDAIREEFRDLVIDAETGELRVKNFRGVERIAEQMKALIVGELGPDSPIALDLIAGLDQLLLDPNFKSDIRSKIAEEKNIEAGIDVLITPNPILEPFDTQDLADKVRGAAADAAQNVAGLPTGGGVGHFGARLRGGAGASVSVPISVKPEISIDTAGSNAAEIGAGIAEVIAAGVQANASRIASALAVSLGQALRGTAALSASFAVLGAGLASALAAGVQSQAAAVGQAGAQIGQVVVVGAAAFTNQMGQIGVLFAAVFATGVSSGTGAAASAGAALAGAANAGAGSGSLFDEGLSLAIGMALGIAAGRSAVVNAAIAIANAAASAARAALGIASPSKVFRDIGRDMGRGLAEGLSDSETTIDAAVNEAISRAIEAARARVPNQGAARAGLAAGLFGALQPARIPGGPTEADIMRVRIEAWDQGIGALTDLRRQFADAAEENERLVDELEQNRASIVEELRQLREATKQALVEAFSKRGGGLDIFRQRINLSGLRGQVRAAFNELFREPEAARAGETAQERQERERRNRNAATFNRNARALDRNTDAGRQAINTILDFGQRIRELGESMLSSGASTSSVIATLRQHRDQLIAGARAAGLNGRVLNDLIRQLGLSDEQLRNFRRTAAGIGRDAAREAADIRERGAEATAGIRRDILANLAGSSRSLDVRSEAGRRNRETLLDAFQGIRNFGAELLASGSSPADVAAEMKRMRDQVINLARSLGFNNTQILDLVRTLGLTDEQLAEFIRQLGEAGDAANPPTTPTPAPSTGLVIGPGGRLPVGFRDINVHVPFGDPEAIAFATANRVAFEMAGL